MTIYQNEIDISFCNAIIICVTEQDINSISDQRIT